MQLLTDCQNPESLFRSPEWALEEKLDGDRMIVAKRGHLVICATRQREGLMPPPTVEAVALLSDHNWAIDGELMPGGEFVAFDVLVLDGRHVREQGNGTRRDLLLGVSPFRTVRRAVGEEAKRALFDAIRQEKGEGGVFKRITGVYAHGERTKQDHPSAWVRLKWYETESFTVSAVNVAKCSVEVTRGGQTFGSVPSSFHSLPKVGDTIRVRYDAVTASGKLLRAKIVK